MAAQFIPENLTWEYLQEDYMVNEKYFLTLDDGTMAVDKGVLFCANVRSTHFELMEADFDRGEVFSDSMAMSQQIFAEREGLI